MRLRPIKLLLRHFYSSICAVRPCGRRTAASAKEAGLFVALSKDDVPAFQYQDLDGGTYHTPLRDLKSRCRNG
jgi:hypothetical protein